MLFYGTSECAAVLGVLTHPPVLPETHAQTKLPIFPTCGIPLVITSSYPINNRLAKDIDSLLFQNNTLISCLFIYKCTVVPVVPDLRVAWTTSGIVDWNHATELLKQHSGSKWHQDSSLCG